LLKILELRCDILIDIFQLSCETLAQFLPFIVCRLFHGKVTPFQLLTIPAHRSQLSIHALHLVLLLPNLLLLVLDPLLQLEFLHLRLPLCLLTLLLHMHCQRAFLLLPCLLGVR
jgi:hypothetical protein